MNVIKQLFIAGICASLIACTSVGKGVSNSENSTFIADSKEVIVASYPADEKVRLTFNNGTTKELTRVVSGSGARYVEGTLEWWEHQGKATYSKKGKTLFTGKFQEK